MVARTVSFQALEPFTKGALANGDLWAQALARRFPTLESSRSRERKKQKFRMRPCTPGSSSRSKPSAKDSKDGMAEPGPEKRSPKQCLKVPFVQRCRGWWALDEEGSSLLLGFF